LKPAERVSRRGVFQYALSGTPDQLTIMVD